MTRDLPFDISHMRAGSRLLGEFLSYSYVALKLYATKLTVRLLARTVATRVRSWYAKRELRIFAIPTSHNYWRV